VTRLKPGVAQDAVTHLDSFRGNELKWDSEEGTEFPAFSRSRNLDEESGDRISGGAVKSGKAGVDQADLNAVAGRCR